MKITLTSNKRQKPDFSNLGFGRYFTDHMFVMEYDVGKGWHSYRIEPHAPFLIEPASAVLHYAQMMFEGMKAYRTADNTIQLFRPECNAIRLQDSSDRLCIPPIPVEDYIQAVKALVELEGAPFKFFCENRAEWAVETCFTYPGAIQYYGPSEVCDITTRTLALEKA